MDLGNIILNENEINAGGLKIPILKGDKGDKGDTGQAGYTPQRGTDYWTNADISVIEQYCADYIDANITDAIGGAY